MKTAIFFLGVGIIGLVLGLLPRSHPNDYIVSYVTQTNGSTGWTTSETLTHGTKWAKADYQWFKTNCVSGATNVSVIILNIIKLDD